MKKVLALTIAILMLTLSFVSCSNSSDDNAETTPLETVAQENTETTLPEVEETTRLYPELSSKKYDGELFNVLYYDTVARHNWSFIPNEIDISVNNGEILNDAVYNRDMAVEMQYGVDIIATVPDSSMKSALSNSILAGDHQFDLVDICMTEVVNFFNAGLFASIDNLDVDFDQPWFDQNSIAGFTINGKKIACVSDISYFDKLSTVVTFYNSAMGENLGIGSLYKTATDGNFTIDLMLSYATQATSDLNSDGVMNADDSYCISCQNDGSYYMLHGAGITTVNNNGSDLTFNLNTELSISTLEKIFSIMSDTSKYFNRQTAGISDTVKVSQFFSENKALFMLRPMQTLFDLRTFDAKFEILPTPKFYDTQTSYSSPVNPYAGTCLCLPKGNEDYEKPSAIIEMLAAESHYTVMPVLYDVVLDVKLVNSPEASEILDIAFNTRIYDVGLIWGIGSIRGIVSSNMPNVASSVKSMQKSSEKIITKLLEDAAKLE